MGAQMTSRARRRRAAFASSLPVLCENLVSGQFVAYISTQYLPEDTMEERLFLCGWRQRKNTVRLLRPGEEREGEGVHKKIWTAGEIMDGRGRVGMVSTISSKCVPLLPWHTL